MKHNFGLQKTDKPMDWYCPERIGKLLGDAELKDKMASTTSSKNWLTLIRIVAKIIMENLELKISFYQLKMEYLNHDLHIEALKSKMERMENDKASHTSTN